MGAGTVLWAAGKVERQLVLRLFKAIKVTARQTARGGGQDTNARRQQHGGEPQHRRQVTAHACTAPRAHDREGSAGLLAKVASAGTKVELQVAGKLGWDSNLPQLRQHLRSSQAGCDLVSDHGKLLFSAFASLDQAIHVLVGIHGRSPLPLRPGPLASPRCSANARNARNCDTRTAPGCLPRALASSSIFSPASKRPSTRVSRV